MPKDEKLLRLLAYLKELSKLRQRQEVSLDKYHTCLWLEDLRQADNCSSSLLEPKTAKEKDFLFEIRRPKEPKTPEFPEVCRKWMELKEGVAFLKPSIKVEAEVRFLNVLSQRASQKWEDSDAVYKDEHIKWEKSLPQYDRLFKLHQDLKRFGESIECFVGVGLLQWGTIKRHLLTLEAEIQIDSETGTLAIDVNSKCLHVLLETDMLPPEHCELQLSPNLKECFEGFGTSFCDHEAIKRFLTSVVQQLDAKGVYEPGLKPKEGTIATPIIQFAPAVFLRKRSIQSLIQCLDGLKTQVESGVVSRTFRDIAEEVEPERNESGVSEKGNTVLENDPEVYFPRPSNEEQRKIVEHLKFSDVVLVQGPPGTGKSHTIANLICHLLAKGKRLLITAKGKRALYVIKEKLPEEIQTLCIQAFGGGNQELSELNTSIYSMFSKRDNWNNSKEAEKAKAYRETLDALRQERVSLNRRLEASRKNETNEVIINTLYAGKPMHIAQRVQEKRKQYEWFCDNAVPFTQDFENFEVLKQDLILQIRCWHR